MEKKIRLMPDDEFSFENFVGYLKKATTNKTCLFACIGSDRTTGDCLGPLVGKWLEEKGYLVIGTLDSPLHGANLEYKIEEINNLDYFVITIDASLGPIPNIGTITCAMGPAKPGMGVGKTLPEIGQMNINAIVNVGGYMPESVIASTSLKVVWELGQTIVKAIERAVPIWPGLPKRI